MSWGRATVGSGVLRITAIEAAPLFGESPKGGWSAEIAPEDSIHALIAVHTEAGITGYGSVFTDGRLVKAALPVLEPLYRGENALEPQLVSEKLHQNTFWMGRGGTLTHTISGIDIALWDILGKVTSLSVGQLLGGRHRECVQPYCSLLMEPPAQMRDVIAEYRACGFRAFKIGWGPFGRMDDVRLDEAIVAAARDAAGDGAKLFVDAGASDAYWPQGLKWAMRTARMLAEYGVGWFEEPLRPDAIEEYCELRRASPVPIAGGEVLTRRQAFLPWLTRGAFDIVQPDVTKVGGISEQRRIAWMADEFGVRYVGHGWNTALGVAADLQLATALPGVDLVEFIGGSAYVDGILETPFTLDAEGFLAIPTGAGLGVRLDRLESESLHIIREVAAECRKPVLLYSIGKDSTVLLHLVRKAFFPAPPPFPLLHIDTGWKFRDMIAFRDATAARLGVTLIVRTNEEGRRQGINPFDHGASYYTHVMKTEALRAALTEGGYDAAFGGARRDEEKSRAKERIFSFRTASHEWDPRNQRPELWRLYNGRVHGGESIRVFPLSNWTERDIWAYILRHRLPIVPLYFAAPRPVVWREGALIMVDDQRMRLQPGEVPEPRMVRFRSLGCYPLTGAVPSQATTLEAIVAEMDAVRTSERGGRLIDRDEAASMEKKKREGYF